MIDENYVKLAEHLDNLPGGYPKTESGVELKILKKLFTPQEAKIAINLKMDLETPDSIAKRTSIDIIDLSNILESMSKKGLIFRVIKNDSKLYMASQFVIGIWEYHVNDLDKELIKYFNEYIPYLSKKVWGSYKTKQLRVIPISGSLSTKTCVMPYEIAEEIIKNQRKILIAPCICRKEHQIIGKGCDYPLETCFVFGTGADYYKENQIGRIIDKFEALDILKKGMKAGLVLQPGNSKKPINICMCCSCCCQVLKNIKLQPNPGKIINTSWYAKVDTAICSLCGLCIEKCHMSAIILNASTSTIKVDLNRCIGCGVCSINCDLEAVKLFEKESGERWDPPKNTFETFFTIAKERGII